MAPSYYVLTSLLVSWNGKLSRTNQYSPRHYIDKIVMLWIHVKSTCIFLWTEYIYITRSSSSHWHGLRRKWISWTPHWCVPGWQDWDKYIITKPPLNIWQVTAIPYTVLTQSQIARPWDSWGTFQEKIHVREEARNQTICSSLIRRSWSHKLRILNYNSLHSITLMERTVSEPLTAYHCPKSLTNLLVRVELRPCSAATLTKYMCSKPCSGQGCWTSPILFWQ